MRAAAGHGLDAVILGKDAIARVDGLDGLLIRDLTSPRNHTYDFARAAEARGIPVLDAQAERASIAAATASAAVRITPRGVGRPAFVSSWYGGKTLSGAPHD